MIKIILEEHNNILHIKNEYSPIVCGNTNYEIEFIFSEDWQKLDEKTAVFITPTHTFSVNFRNNTVNVPALTNADRVSVLVMSAENEPIKLTSSTTSLRLVQTPVTSVLEPAKN